MEESVQQVIMRAIQELDKSLNPGSVPDTDPHLQKVLGELVVAVEARDQMAQRCHELDMQVCTTAPGVDCVRIEI
jgi:protein HOOK3